MWAGVTPDPASGKRRPVALHPCSRVLLEVGPDFWECVWEMGEGLAPSGFVCALGAGRGKGSYGARARDQEPGSPQTPGSWGSGAQFWGMGIHAEECPPSNGLDPVRKEINKG